MAGDTDRMYALLKGGNCDQILAKKALTDELYEQLKDKTTKFGGTLGDCIRPGSMHANRPGIGLRCCDPDAFNTFRPVIDEVIKAYHKTSTIQHPPLDFGNLDNLGLDLKDADPNGQFIRSTRVRVARTVAGFGYHPVMTHQNRLDLEATISGALLKLTGEHKGEYHPIAKMTREEQDRLVREHYLFNDTNSITRSAGCYDDWPTGRGVFYNPDKTFLAWLMETDHMRVIAMQDGSDLNAVFTRLVKACQALQGFGLNWVRDDRLGYVSFCPSNIGNTLRASVHINLPKLSQTPNFQKFCADLNLQIRGADGDETEASGTVFDVSNKRRLGLSEIDAVLEMQKGVKAVIAEEKRLMAL